MKDDSQPITSTNLSTGQKKIIFMCLHPGENLLWAGKDGTYDRKASGGRLRRVILVGMILAAITACGFPLWIWFGMIYKGLTDPDLSFNLGFYFQGFPLAIFAIGTLSVLIVLLFAWMPVKTMLLEVENLYAITESSILYVQPHRSLTGLLPAILQLHPGYESNSLVYVLRINPGKVPEIAAQETSSGWGTLIIDKIVYETEDQWGFKSKKTIPIQFAEIPQVKQVAELARKVLLH